MKKILEDIVLSLYGFIFAMTAWALVECTMITPQPFPDWFLAGCIISSIGLIILFIIGVIWVIYEMMPPKRYGIISGEQICKLLKKA